jgi:UDP-N-acetylglucosamine 2-epimerase (non-hydrolysing)/GDP/UDP-N,N'-diacetylbacillosamine 2-epimerase (hydrolysing)
VIDEASRHAVTKMAHLHFVAAEPYRRRVVQLGESPQRVFDVGAIGLDNIRRLELMSREALEAATGLAMGEVNFLVTYHPVTLDARGPLAPLEELLGALDGFPQARVLFTRPNADTDGRVIDVALDAWTAANSDRARVVTSLGQTRYLSAIKLFDVVIGNSSSGLIEAPSLGTPTVNIGERQAGRLRAPSVIDAMGDDRSSVAVAIRKALSSEHRCTARDSASFLGAGDTSRRIKDTLKATDLRRLLFKHFHDVEDGGHRT